MSGMLVGDVADGGAIFIGDMGPDGASVGDALAVAAGLGTAVEDDGDGVGFAGFMVMPGIGAMLTCGDGRAVIPGIGAIVMPGIGAIVGVA
jgi:hypothetical protein